MNRCQKCDAPLRDEVGLVFCEPFGSIEKGCAPIRFRGCQAVSVSRGVNVRRVKVDGRWVAENRVFLETSRLRVVRVLSSGVLHWVLDDNFKPSEHREQYKPKPGSMWTNARYGLNWLDFTRMLRSIARKRGMALTGFHVSTLAAADMVDNLLTMRRSMA